MEKEQKEIILLCLLVIFLITGLFSSSALASLKKDLALCQDELYETKAYQVAPSTRLYPPPKGLMILIEMKDTVGLANFVNELYQRGIHGYLMVGADFVEENCEDIKKLLPYNLEIAGSSLEDPFWDKSYEEQKEAIVNLKERIEACTGQPLRIISARYMGTDLTTIEVAQELGIPYLFARGTTDTKATVYQAEEYPDVKVVSVSNIPSIKFKYGSLCDYSYYERGGTPDDMLAELKAALQHRQITPVSHTYIGGLKKPWYQMWLNFFDNEEVEWVTIDELVQNEVVVLPGWQIPQNRTAPYTPEKIRPLVSYDEEENIANPCAVDEVGKYWPKTNEESKETPAPEKEEAEGAAEVLMFHNNSGPMCLEAKEFFKDQNIPFEEYLIEEADFTQKLEEKKQAVGNKSEGVSSSFGYYPIIFVGDKAFSGFNAEIGEQILAILEEGD